MTAATAGMGENTCAKCGAAVEAGAVLCVRCGAPLLPEPAVTAGVVTTPQAQAVPEAGPVSPAPSEVATPAVPVPGVPDAVAPPASVEAAAPLALPAPQVPAAPALPAPEAVTVRPPARAAKASRFDEDDRTAVGFFDPSITGIEAPRSEELPGERDRTALVFLSPMKEAAASPVGEQTLDADPPSFDGSESKTELAVPGAAAKGSSGVAVEAAGRDAMPRPLSTLPDADDERPAWLHPYVLVVGGMLLLALGFLIGVLLR